MLRLLVSRLFTNAAVQFVVFALSPGWHNPILISLCVWAATKVVSSGRSG